MAIDPIRNLWYTGASGEAYRLTRIRRLHTRRRAVVQVCWATPLYEFLRRCNASPLERSILDCGAGGSDPPLALFYHHGYQTWGIEIAEKPLADAQSFCREHGLPLNIYRGDMRRIPFANQCFSHVYAFNAIFFMTKPDIDISMAEMARVLRPGGLWFVNFVSVEDPDGRPFCETAPARLLLGSETFAKHQDSEPDAYFEGYDIQRREKRILEKANGAGMVKQVTLEYIARKR